MSIEILDCWKRKRDICIKNVISSQNTAFDWIPALSFLCPSIHKRDLDTKQTTPNIEVCPESLALHTAAEHAVRSAVKILVS